jgi:hypothetical protein
VIEFRCTCAKAGRLPETAVGKRARCPACGKMLQFVSAEPLAEDAALGDFDASLLVVPGQLKPEADQYLLGGAADIHIGKAPDRNILLRGQRVSRQHCKLARVNFGPSVWKIFDFNSTNGLIVNGQRVIEHELQDGDTITIGEFTLEYIVDAPATDITAPGVAAAISPPTMSGRVCPSCGKTLPTNVRICAVCRTSIP